MRPKQLLNSPCAKIAILPILEHLYSIFIKSFSVFFWEPVSFFSCSQCGASVHSSLEKKRCTESLHSEKPVVFVWPLQKLLIKYPGTFQEASGVITGTPSRILCLSLKQPIIWLLVFKRPVIQQLGVRRLSCYCL